MFRDACAHPLSRPYARIRGLKSMKAKEAWQACANRTCAQVWAGQVQEGAGHARTMFTRRHGARMQWAFMRTQRAWSTAILSVSMQQAICEYQSSAGVWIWANLVSPHCVMVRLLQKHVERLAILLAPNCCRLAPCSLRPTRSSCSQRVLIPEHAAPQTCSKAQISGPPR